MFHLLDLNITMVDSTTHFTAAQKDELMDQVKQQIVIANAQELLTVRI